MIAVERDCQRERGTRRWARAALWKRAILPAALVLASILWWVRFFASKIQLYVIPTNSYLSTVLSTHRLRLMRGSIIGGCTLSRDIRSSRAVGSLVWSFPFSDTHTFAAIGTFLCGLTTSVKTYRPLFGGVPMTFDPG